jgi:hypothetical protein
MPTNEKLLNWVDKLKSKHEDVKFSYHGGKLKVNQIQHFLHNSYQKNKNDNYDGYQMDKELSGNRFQAYYHPENDHLVTVHRGSQGIHDWINNVRYGLFNDKSSKRFQHAKEMQKKAEDKYSTKNVTIVAHSLGKQLAQEANKNNNELITLNGATTPYDIGKKKKENEYNMRTTYDIPSALENLKPKNGSEINIPSKSHNILTEHSTNVLNRLNPEMNIGR